jgi:hypothetical protein
VFSLSNDRCARYPDELECLTKPIGGFFFQRGT